jgi:hypothetical protein
VGGRPAIVITVHGKPVGQGSLRHGETGMAYHANGKILKPWRAAVEAAAVDATGRHAYAAPKPVKVKGEKTKRPPAICTTCGVAKKRHGLYLGAVGLTVVATFARPKSDPARAYPITSNIGDWDHHGRSISDALTGVVFADDAQIVTGSATKTYPGGHRDSLLMPGAVIRVWEVS